MQLMQCPFKPASIAFDSAGTFLSEKFTEKICHQRRHESKVNELCECPDVLQKVKDAFIPIKYVAGLNLNPQMGPFLRSLQSANA